MLTKKQKKWLGGIIVIIGIILISPIPDFFDTIGFSLFAMLKGIDVNISNIGTYFLDYIIFSILLGVVLLILGLNLLGQNGKYLIKKLGLGKYKIAIFIGIMLVAVIAFLDVQGLIVFSDLGIDYTAGDFPQSWWFAFRNTAYILMALVAVSYYYFVNRDKSETLAVFLTPFILFWVGLSDVLYFVFRKVPIPETFPWLDNHIIIGNISRLLGYDVVTSFTLLFSVLLGFISVFIVTKILKEKF